MISALYREIVPSSSAAAVPGSRAPKACAIPIRLSARARDSPSAYATWSRGELLVQLPRIPPGQLGDRGELTGMRVGLDPVPPAHHPDQLRLRDTAEPGIGTGRGVGGDRQPGAARQHIQHHPRAERRRRAGTTHPGIPAPSLAAPARAARWWPPSTASSSSAAASSIPASSSEVKGSKFPSSSSSPGRLVVLAGGRASQNSRRLRVAVQPGEVLVSPGVRGNR